MLCTAIRRFWIQILHKGNDRKKIANSSYTVGLSWHYTKDINPFNSLLLKNFGSYKKSFSKQKKILLNIFLKNIDSIQLEIMCALFSHTKYAFIKR